MKKISEEFICKECGQIYLKKDKLSRHINSIHGDTKKYYDKWIKKENEGHCKICNQEAKFRNMFYGYNNVCDNKNCLSTFKYTNLSNGMIKKYGAHCSVHVPNIKIKQENTCIKKFGYKSPLKSKEIRKKIEKTNLRKYNNINPLGNIDIIKKGKETKKEKYNDENFTNRQKSKETCIKKYGVEHVLQSKIIRQKSKTTCVKRYGVEYAQQNKDIHQKQQISGFKSKTYKNIFYRGSYELDFLKLCVNKFVDIQSGPSIKYQYKSKNRIYHSDFIIPSLNLIIECKNSYLFKRDNNIINAKKNACIKQGYNYIIIIDKQYDELDKFILNFCFIS